MMRNTQNLPDQLNADPTDDDDPRVRSRHGSVVRGNVILDGADRIILVTDDEEACAN